MKLHRLKIKNFRAIAGLNLDFTDSTSRPRPITLIVGPNGCGKTSILDAIHVVVNTMEDYKLPNLREGLEFNRQQLVRGRTTVEIEFIYSIDEKEARAINEIFEHLGMPSPFKQIPEPPCESPATCKWIYPRLPNHKGRPYSIMCGKSAKVLGARGQTKIAVVEKSISRSYFERIGGVCYLDQRRSFRLVKEVKNVQNNDTQNSDSIYNDVLSWVYSYYQKHSTWNQEKYGESYWSKIQRLFNKICSPAELIGPESGPDMTTLVLRKNNVEYDISQMSSGEHQVLRAIVGLVAETALNSIVLIDEIELHLHPAWQRKFLNVLREEKSLNNQYIITTHSPFVKDLFFKDEIIDLGELDN